MNILQVNNHHEILGGSERVYKETGRMLELNNHNVYYFSTTENQNYHKKQNELIIFKKNYLKNNLFTNIINIPSFFYSFKNQNILDSFLNNQKIDVAHLHIFYGSLSNSILPSLRKYKIPIVMSVHEYKMLCPAYTFLNGANKICEKCKGKYFYNAIRYKCTKDSITLSSITALESYFRNLFTPYQKYISHFIMVSNFIKDIHIKYLPQIKNKSSVLYNFVDLDKYNFSLKPTTKKIVYFGRLSKEKGLLTLIDTLKYIPHIQLDILGKGPLASQIKTLVNNEAPNINILGFKTGTELREIIANAKFVVVPSEWYENNPMTIIESFALGTPVIGSRIGGIPELVVEGKTGFLFEPFDSYSLKTVLLKSTDVHYDDYLKMRSNCRQFAEDKFNSKIYYENLMKIYKSVL